MASACPARFALPADKPPKPDWCGECDQRTRLIEGMRHGQTVMWRCVRCHPLAHKSFSQHKKCGGCAEWTYQWDHMACEHHQALAL
jgi:hypothetical protein